MGRMIADKEFILQLVRLGIGHGDPERVFMPEKVKWGRIKGFAVTHGLTAVILDGIGKLQERFPDGSFPSEKLTAWWIGEVMHCYEFRYDRYVAAVGELAAFYRQHGLKMMLLKGYACSLNWPRPNHRPLGDMDIWMFDRYQEADRLLETEKGIPVDTSDHHHTVFQWNGFWVENHYDFLNVHHHQSNVAFEAILKPLARDDSHTVEVAGETVCIPSPLLHALFLLRHSIVHFTAKGINLRILLDWAFFVKAHTREIDWPWLEGILDQFGMKPIYQLFNAICVEDLGFDAALFPVCAVDPALKERVLDDILEPEFPNDEPKNLLSRVVFRFRRWHSNRWKRALSFNESDWSSLWNGIVSHLMKPRTI